MGFDRSSEYVAIPYLCGNDVINRICGNDLWSGILGSGVLNDGNDEH
jgi:hypothetical protein